MFPDKQHARGAEFLTIKISELFTIIIPTHDCPQLLHQTLKSLIQALADALKQSLRDINLTDFKVAEEDRRSFPLQRLRETPVCILV